MVKLTSNVNRLEHTFIILQNKKPNKKKFSFNKGLINKHMSNKTKPNREREREFSHEACTCIALL